MPTGFFRQSMQGVARSTVNNQTPFTYNARYPANAQSPSNAQSPFTYNARYPATYPANAQQPFTYSFRNPFTYNYRSPYTYSYNSPVGVAYFFMTAHQAGYTYPPYVGYSAGVGISVGTPIGYPAAGQPAIDGVSMTSGVNTYPFTYLPFVSPTAGIGSIMLWKSTGNWFLTSTGAPNLKMGALAFARITNLSLSPRPSIDVPFAPIPSTTTQIQISPTTFNPTSLGAFYNRTKVEWFV